MVRAPFLVQLMVLRAPAAEFDASVVLSEPLPKRQARATLLTLNMRLFYPNDRVHAQGLPSGVRQRAILCDCVV